MDRISRILEMLQETTGDNFIQHALALEYIKVGREDEARELFELILTRDSGYIGSYYHLAKLLERNNETQLALSWYQKGMEAARIAGDRHAYSELQSAYDELNY